MADNDDVPKKSKSELEKYHAGEDFDTAKLWSEMDDDFWEKTMQGMEEGAAEKANKADAKDKKPDASPQGETALNKPDTGGA
jgi:hypothetical protein